MKIKVTLYLTEQAKKSLDDEKKASGLGQSAQVEILIRDRDKSKKK